MAHRADGPFYTLSWLADKAIEPSLSPAAGTLHRLEAKCPYCRPPPPTRADRTLVLVRRSDKAGRLTRFAVS
jgi:hypothetical protein